MSNCRQIASHSLFAVPLRPPTANFCQARTFCRTALYGDTLSCGGKALSRHHLMPACHTLQTIPQKRLLSVSAVVSAANAADLRYIDLEHMDSANAVIDAATAASSAVEPTLQSLGLASSFPGGIVQAGLESLHIGLDVPWWSAIVIGTVILRFMLFPMVILGQRRAAEMHNHMPTMQRLQQRMVQARKAGDIQATLRAQKELTDYMQRNNVNPFKSLIVPFMQVPIFISVYKGVNEMAALPVVSMQSGGLFWFSDLTVADPYFALPLMTAATLLVTIEIGADSVAASDMDQTMRIVMRAMPVLMIPVIAKFPAAMLCYWLTSNAFSLVQVLFLRIPAVRQFFKVPARVNHKLQTHVRETDAPNQGFMEGFRQSMENMRLAREIEERQRYNALHMKKSSKETARPSSQSEAESRNVTEKSRKSQQL